MLNGKIKKMSLITNSFLTQNLYKRFLKEFQMKLVRHLDFHQTGVGLNGLYAVFYQFHHLLPEFSARENVMLACALGGMSVREAGQKADAMLAQVGLGERLAHKPGELSGGERQRVAIARALVNEPECVLMDEPTGNLDEQTGESVQRLIEGLRDRLGIAFVVVTHDMGMARSLGRVLKLEQGRLHPLEAAVS